ncbi:Uncharacterized protein HZ326_20634 [Fusarium oxysporum f. sp. albedinis]|nr:Uncharacterized protein HZ326_20634 [Fusarium oxysporum f. sp. albedinis]
MSPDRDHAMVAKSKHQQTTSSPLLRKAFPLAAYSQEILTCVCEVKNGYYSKPQPLFQTTEPRNKTTLVVSTVS